MKEFVFPRLKLLAGIVIIQFVLTVLASFLIFPLIVPMAGNAGHVYAGALLFFLVGIVGGVAAAVLALNGRHDTKFIQDMFDAVKLPGVVLDPDNRYLVINSAAEQALSLNRIQDRGQPFDSRVAAAIAGNRGEPDMFHSESILEIGDAQLQPLHFDVRTGNTTGNAAGLRMVFLRDVSQHLLVREAIREINQTMIALNANTMKIASSSVSLSQGATEQATSLGSITASMDEFSKKIQGNTESAAQGTKLAAQARDAAERSGNEIVRALSAMNEVQDAGIRIARIVKLIDDIAFQTNLLALNAAVEAARAGRQGKGFAVVADEVRNLAGRSAKAAKDTASMVEDVTERIGNASAYISKLEEMLRNIVHDAIRMADSSAETSATSSEQAQGILRVNRELGQMNSVTHSTMEAAEQTATAVEILTRQVENLKNKLDSLGAAFSLDSPAKTQSNPHENFSINLLDDPDSFSDAHLTHSYLNPDDYSRFSRPTSELDMLGSSGTDDRSMDWDFHGNPFAGASGNENRTSPLNGFERGSSGFGSEYADASGMHVLETSTPEGDRIVKPNQNVPLDDSEFGRY